MLTFFKRKNNLETDILDDLAILKDEVTKLKTRLTKVEAEVLDVATAQDIIRNKVLRKIQNKKEITDELETWNGIPLV